MPVFIDLQIFYGKATDSLAYVYARVPSRPEWIKPRLAGIVRGPRAEGVRTLPTTVPLVDVGPGDSMLARAIVPDPSFWSPDVPAVYDVEVELCDESGVVEAATCQLGIRQFGARGTSWFLGGRRWVLRGLIMDDLPTEKVDVFRSTNTSVVSFDPSEEMCDAASRLGIVLVPFLQGDELRIQQELRRLSRWPAVTMAIIDCEELVETDLKFLAPNVELVQLRHEAAAETPDSKWATALAGYADDPVRFQSLFGSSTVPVLAIRPVDPKMDVSDRRAMCDRLQRDLAPIGDFAGYIV
jgi:hypothetical protein